MGIVLREAGYHVRIVQQRARALAILRRSKVDLIAPDSFLSSRLPPRSTCRLSWSAVIRVGSIASRVARFPILAKPLHPSDLVVFKSWENRKARLRGRHVGSRPLLPTDPKRLRCRCGVVVLSWAYGAGGGATLRAMAQAGRPLPIAKATSWAEWCLLC